MSNEGHSGRKAAGFLTRSRPQWARRSVAGQGQGSGVGGGVGEGSATRSIGSIDSGDRTTGPSIDTMPALGQSQSQATPSKQQHQHQQQQQQQETAPASGRTSSGTKSTPSPVLPLPTAMTETALVENLVKRIVARLPTYSTTVETNLDADPVIRQAGASLYDYSKRRLPMVLQPLLLELDALIKPPHYRPDTDFVSVDLLRSQLYLLLTITNCTTHFWLAMDTPERRSRRPAFPPTPNSSSNPAPAVAFLDPPPLDDQLAKQVLALCVFFLKQHAHTSDSTVAPSSVGENANASIASLTQHALASLAAADPSSSSSSTRPLPQSTSSSETMTPKPLPTTRQAVVQEIFTLAGRIIYFLSASNWTIVFGRVKARISHYAASDDLPDSSEMRILEWCCLDRRRLSSVIQELCNTFIHLKRPAQASMSVILCRAVWSWIESYGAEFSTLTVSGRRLEGGPEVLFDIIYTLSENSKRKTFAWPVMTMLLACCPDILGKLAVGEGHRSAGLTKKVQFLESLKKAMKSPKLADVACACYADLCRAATCTQPDPSDPSALRLLVSDLDFDLKSKLFDPHLPFLNSEGIPDVVLMTEALVALYRLDPNNIAQNPFPALLDPMAADAAKLTAAFALHILAREGQNLPWTPSVSPLLDTVTRPLRTAFIDIVTSELPDNSSATGSGSSRRGPANRLAAADEHSRRNELARAILRVWTTDLRFLVQGQQGAPDADALRLALVSLLDEPNHVSVRTLAVATISAFSRSELEGVLVAKEDAYESAGSLSVPYAVARHVIESKLDMAEEKAALELQHQDLMRHLALFGPGASQRTSAVVSQAGWDGLWTSLEIALLLCLVSSETPNRKLALQCLHVAATVLDLAHGVGTAGASTEARAPSNLIQSFANEYRTRALTGATRADQRTVARVVFGALTAPTPGLLAAWDEAMRRWKEISGVIFSRVVDDESDNSSDAMRREQLELMKSPEQQLEEWSSLCSFLLAASGVCALAGEGSWLETVVSPDHLPARFFRRVDRPRNIDRLIQELVDLLVSDSTQVRDAVRDALGSDLSPQYFPLFFKHLKSIVGHFFDNEKGIPVTEEAFTVFIEQTVSVLRLMFDRVERPITPAAAGTLDSLILSFTTYIQRLGFTPAAYGLKISLCHLCKSVFAQRVGQHADSVLRNVLLEHFVSWASDARPAYPDDAIDRLHNELDAACLAAMVPLLKGLVVHPTDVDSSVTHLTDSRLFSRYFDFFAFTLHRTTPTQALSQKGVSLAPLRPRNAHDLELRANAIEALASLVSANVDPAYHQFAEMGSSSDLSARSAYLETLVKVIEKGTTFDRLVRPPENDTFAQLINLIRQPDLTLAMALCEVCTATHYEDLTEIFLKIFDTPKSIAKFLKAVIEMEVSVTDHESTLFRGNSFATRILTAYARARGYHYLRNTLKDLLLTLCRKPHEFSMDFDPHRQTAADDAASRNLEQVTEAFLVCISQSIEQVPATIREICSHIGEVVGDRFPESIFTAIGGFIFLRFINPAIVSPENIDLDLPSDNRDIRRGLLMITKVLQALANNVRFGAKEPGMRKLNDFMDVNIFGMTRFLQAISHYNRSDETLTSLRDDVVPEDNVGLDETDRSFLHQFLHDNMDKLGMELLQRKAPTFRHWHDGNEGFSPTIGPRTWERVTSLIASLGPPPETASRAAAAGSEAPEKAYATFMARNEARMSSDGLVWSRIFYETSGNKTGLPTFVLLAHRIKAETADLESLVFYVLQQLAEVAGPFEILVDCTKFSEANEVPTQWIVQLMAILPASTSQNLSKIFIFGPNTLLKRYLRKLGRLMSFERLDSRRAVALSSVSELEQHFSQIDLMLPASTVALGRERWVMFNHITERHQIRVEHPVIFKIGQTHVLISTMKKQDLFSDVKCALEDVLEFSDIEEMRKILLTEGEGISIRIAGQRALRTFLTNARRDELLAALNTARNSAPMKPASTSRDRFIHPEDVTAVLINTILLNLCSEHADLRAHAHDLLCSLVMSNRLEGFEDLAKCRGLHVPAGHLSFLSSVSERLAAAAPTHSLGVMVQFCTSLTVASASEGAAYIHCLRPWLHNLNALVHTPREESEAVQVKLRRCLRQLLAVAIREPALHAALATRIWPAVGKLDFLIPLLIDESIRSITSFDIGSAADPCPIVCQVLVALAGGTLVRGRIVTRLRKTLIRSTLKVVPQLTLNADWPEIAALIRIELALSFDSRLGAQLYLPDVLHACISLVATGPELIRSAVQGLLVNTVHSLGKDHAVDAAKLRTIQEALTGPDADRLFELTLPSPTDVAKGLTWDVSDSGAELVRLMAEVIDAGAPSIDAANAWRARWTGLSTANCFQHSPALQPRAYIVIGGVGLGHQMEIDADLIFQILTTLRSRIRLGSKNDGALAAVIVQCLVKTLPGLAPEASFWHSLFWIAMSLLQIGNPKISAASIRLLAAVLEGLDARDFFKGDRTMEEVLLAMQPSESPAQVKYVTQLQQYSGVDLHQHLSFGIATLVSKSLNHGPATSDAIDFLFKLLLCSRRLDDSPSPSPTHARTKTGGAPPRQVPTAAVGYFLVLLPVMVRQNRLPELLVVAGLDDIDDTGLSASETYAIIASRLNLVDDEQAFLAFALLSALARAAKTDAEYLAVFAFLRHVARIYPDVAFYLFDSIAPILNSVVAASEDFEVLDAAQAIIQSQSRSAPSSERMDGNAALVQLGFAALTWDPVATYSSSDLVPGTVTATQKELANITAHLLGDILVNPPET